MSDVTRLLGEMAAGEPDAAGELMEAVYAELRRIAANQMGMQSGQTLQPTALVHEAWLRLGGEHLRGWESRRHFYAAAAQAMRHILVDRARQRQALRHGGGQQRIDLHAIEVAALAEDERVLELDEALESLAAVDAKKAELVKLRYFAGFTIEETADALGISVPTANRWWAYARTWLYREIKTG
jgi:RNA polymerase sigma factor (TIGR02999 family)